MGRVSAICLGVALLLGVPAPCAAIDAPDTEVAKRYFYQGKRAYAAADYATAIDRFSAAKRVKPLPAFDYNLARCYERIDDPERAIAAYRAYVAAAPRGDMAAESNARIGALEQRLSRSKAVAAPTPAVVQPVPAATPAPVVDSKPAIVAAAPRPRRRYTGGWVGLGLTAAFGLAAVGTGVYTVGQHASLRGGCGATPDGCQPSQVSSLTRPALATDILIGATAVAAITTVVLFAVEARRHVSPRITSLLQGRVVF